MKKNIVKYLMIFSVTSIIAFIATVLFVNINNHKLNRLNRHQLAFVDLESGEVIPFPEFEHKETETREQICLRNRNGQIIFWGEIDYSSKTLSGDILLTPSMVQIGNYYITYNCNSIQTEIDGESRYYLTLHY